MSGAEEGTWRLAEGRVAEAHLFVWDTVRLGCRAVGCRVSKASGGQQHPCMVPHPLLVSPPLSLSDIPPSFHPPSLPCTLPPSSPPLSSAPRLQPHQVPLPWSHHVPPLWAGLSRRSPRALFCSSTRGALPSLALTASARALSSPPTPAPRPEAGPLPATHPTSVPDLDI
eukprot:3235654-Rhodomonas_salina.2